MTVPQTASRLTLKRLVLQEVSGYAPLVHRGWSTIADAHSVQHVRQSFLELPPAPLDELPQRSHLALTPEFAHAANEFLQLQVQGRPAVVAGGWEAPRFRFVLEATYEFPQLGVSTEHVFTGYTDRLGLSANKELDAQMVFTINATRTMRSLGAPGTGLFSGYHMVGAEQVLSNAQSQGLTGLGVLYRQRPEDIFACISRLEAEIGDAIDARTVLTGVAVLSAQANLAPAVYLQQLLEAFSRASQLQDSPAVQFSRMDTLVHARGVVAEASVVRNPVLLALSNVHGRPATGTFCLNDLVTLGLSTDQVLVSSLSKKKAPVRYDWSSTDEHTRKAQHLAVMLPGLLAQCNFTRALVRLQSHGVHTDVTITDVHGIQHPATEPYSRSMQKLRETLGLHVGALFGQRRWKLNADIDPSAETQLWLELEGKEVHYVIPSFMDSLISPMIASTQTEQMALARDIDTLMGLLLPA